MKNSCNFDELLFKIVMEFSSNLRKKISLFKTVYIFTSQYFLSVYTDCSCPYYKTHRHSITQKALRVKDKHF